MKTDKAISLVRMKSDRETNMCKDIYAQQHYFNGKILKRNVHSQVVLHTTFSETQTLITVRYIVILCQRKNNAH